MEKGINKTNSRNKRYVKHSATDLRKLWRLHNHTLDPITNHYDQEEFSPY